MMKMLMALLLSMMVMAGCQNEQAGNIPEETVATTQVAVETSQVEVTSKAAETTAEVTETATTAPEVLDESVTSQMDTYKAEGDLVAAWSLFEHATPKVNKLTAEYLLLEYLTLAQDLVFDASEPLFAEAGNKAQNMIYDITGANEDKFDYVHVISAEDKYFLIDLMSGDEQALIQEIFKQGYGLISAEGSYYAWIDYRELEQRYGKAFTEPTLEMLTLFEDIQLNQTSVEEYLAISPKALMERSIALERHLMKYPEAPELYKTMVRRNLNICLYELAFPSPFDGGVDEDGTLSSEFEVIYEQIMEEKPSPVVTQVVVELTEWIATRDNGYLGDYNDMEDLYIITGGIHGRATERVTDLY